VLISEEVCRSVEETFYLSSIPGMKESIVSGMALRDYAMHIDILAENRA
jgi:hypothetical protein